MIGITSSIHWVRFWSMPSSSFWCFLTHLSLWMCHSSFCHHLHGSCYLHLRDLLKGTLQLVQEASKIIPSQNLSSKYLRNLFFFQIMFCSGFRAHMMYFFGDPYPSYINRVQWMSTDGRATTGLSIEQRMIKLPFPSYFISIAFSSLFSTHFFLHFFFDWDFIIVVSVSVLHFQFGFLWDLSLSPN